MRRATSASSSSMPRSAASSVPSSTPVVAAAARGTGAPADREISSSAASAAHAGGFSPAEAKRVALLVETVLDGDERLGVRVQIDLVASCQAECFVGKASDRDLLDGAQVPGDERVEHRDQVRTLLVQRLRRLGESNARDAADSAVQVM